MALYRAKRPRFGYGPESRAANSLRNVKNTNPCETKVRFFAPLLPVGSHKSVLKVPKQGQSHAVIRGTPKRCDSCVHRKSTRATDGITAKLLQCGIASEALRRNMPLRSQTSWESMLDVSQAKGLQGKILTEKKVFACRNCPLSFLSFQKVSSNVQGAVVLVRIGCSPIWAGNSSSSSRRYWLGRFPWKKYFFEDLSSFSRTVRFRFLRNGSEFGFLVTVWFLGHPESL